MSTRTVGLGPSTIAFLTRLHLRYATRLGLPDISTATAPGMGKIISPRVALRGGIQLEKALEVGLSDRSKKEYKREFCNKMRIEMQ